MVKKQLDKAGIESFLLDRMKTTSQMYLEGKTQILSKFSSSMVEVKNEELPRKCPSVDGFKFIVHATVQVGVYIKNCQSQILSFRKISVRGVFWVGNVSGIPPQMTW